MTPDRYRPCGPRYERHRSFGPDPERRDRYQRLRTQRAVEQALRRSELTPVLAAVLTQLLAQCKGDTLLTAAPDGQARCSGWWSLKFIHDLIYPPTDTDTDTDGDRAVADIDDVDDRQGARTAGEWMAALRKAGWVDVIHRSGIVNGEPWGTSNLWRIQIPDHLRTELYAIEDGYRSKRRPRDKTSGRAQPPKTQVAMVADNTADPGDGPGTPEVATDQQLAAAAEARAELRAWSQRRRRSGPRNGP